MNNQQSEKMDSFRAHCPACGSKNHWYKDDYDSYMCRNVLADKNHELRECQYIHWLRGLNENAPVPPDIPPAVDPLIAKRRRVRELVLAALYGGMVQNGNIVAFCASLDDYIENFGRPYASDT